jgi:large subunit ribosomal protein L30
MADKLRVTQIKSTISHIARNRATIRALGLKRIGHTVEVVDNPATRGMVRQVRFLVSVEEVGDSNERAKAPASSGRGGAGHSNHNPSEDQGGGGASSSHPSDDGEEKA